MEMKVKQIWCSGQCIPIYRRPELLGAGIARSPFLDLLDTMSNPEAYLTPHEYAEWGNPTSTPQALDQVCHHAVKFFDTCCVPSSRFLRVILDWKCRLSPTT